MHGQMHPKRHQRTEALLRPETAYVEAQHRSPTESQPTDNAMLPLMHSGGSPCVDRSMSSIHLSLRLQIALSLVHGSQRCSTL